MKNILLLSLVCNLGLSGAAIYLLKQKPSPGGDVDGISSGSLVEKRKSAARKAIPMVPSLEKRKEFNWESMESQDYKEYIANLRAIGCPEETVQDIIVADINQLYAERARETFKKEFKFWDTKQAFGGFMPDEEQVEKNLALQDEKRKVLEDLLGHPVTEKPDMFSMMGYNQMDMMFGFLPKEKQLKLMEIQTEMASKYAGKEGESLDAASIQKLQKESNEMLAKVLSPEEYREYELRLSPTAMSMRMELGAFEPSQEEFLKIFDMRKKFEEEHGSALYGNAFGVEQNEDRTKAQQVLNDQIKAALGEDRYKEYTRSSDSTYRSMVKVTERAGLNRQAASQLFDVKSVYDQSRDRVIQDSSIPPERKQETLNALRAETQKEVTRMLGDKGYESFKKNHQASIWLENPVVINNPTPQ